MDWKDKEFLDEQFDEIKDEQRELNNKLDAILNHLKIAYEPEEEDSFNDEPLIDE